MEWSLRSAIAPQRPLLGSNGMYPGDDVIDVFGIDAYNESALSGGITDPSIQFLPAITFANAHGKRWAIGELGSCNVKNNANGRATYLKNAIEYWVAQGSAPAYVTYFDVNWSSCDYRLDSDPAATAVWKQAVTQGIGSF